MAATLSAELIDKTNGVLENLRNDLVLRVIPSFKCSSDFQSARLDPRFKSIGADHKKIAETLLDNRNFFTTGVNRFLKIYETEGRHDRIREQETIATAATLSGIMAPDDKVSYHTSSAATSDKGRGGQTRKKASPLEDLTMIQEYILRFLRFRHLNDRRHEIPDAYGKSFEWIYNSGKSIGNTQNGTESDIEGRNDLRSWLEYGSGCFWITGEPGSGKSTLMKFVAGDSRARSLLQLWARNEPLLCASFFFQGSGTRLQKSQRGFLRALLHDSLIQFPELIPIVFPEYCRAFARKPLIGHEPTKSELEAAFELLVRQRVKPLKICFFIDGLDEFDGDAVGLAQYLLAASETVKILLSSRPVPGLHKEFANCGTIQLHDLTKGGIRTYVLENLTKHPRVKELWEMDELEVIDIIEMIVQKSSGVFLWVRLAVRSLTDGLRKQDGVRDLRRRLDALPANLNDFYRYMFGRLSSLHKQQASMLLQIVYRSTFLTGGQSYLTDLVLSYAFEDHPKTAINAKILGSKEEEISLRCANIAEIVGSCSCGLLEMRNQEDKTDNARPVVNFIHKSAVDFIGQPETWAHLRSLTAHTKFDPDIYLACGYLLGIKKFPTSVYALPWSTKLGLLPASVMEAIASDGPLSESTKKHEQGNNFIEGDIFCVLSMQAREALEGLVVAEGSANEAQVQEVIEDLDTTMQMHYLALKHAKNWKSFSQGQFVPLDHWTVFQNDREEGCLPCDSMFALACDIGLVGFIKAKLQKISSIDEAVFDRLSLGDVPAKRSPKLSQTAMARVVNGIANSDSTEFKVSLWNRHMDILDLSIRHGADTNAIIDGGKSLWHRLLCSMPNYIWHMEEFGIVLEKFIRSGSDLKTNICVETSEFRDQGSTAYGPGAKVRLMVSPMAIIFTSYRAAEERAEMNSAERARMINAVSDFLQRLIVRGGGRLHKYAEELKAMNTEDGPTNEAWRKIVDVKRGHDVEKYLEMRMLRSLDIRASQS